MHTVCQRQGDGEQGRDEIIDTEIGDKLTDDGANNEMVMEHDQHAVALRDERVAEMQTAINELTESLSKKEQIIGIKDGIARERYLKIQEMSNENQEKELEHEIEKNDLKHKMHHLKSKNENEISSKEWFEKRFQEEKAEYRKFRYNELQQFKDRELGLQSVMDEFKDENVHLIESNTQLRSRIAELIGSRIDKSGDDLKVKVIEELQDELHKANLEIGRLQDAIESNPKLTEALVNAEEDEAERWKKMYQMACKERDRAIRKNADLSLSLREARKRMSLDAASSHSAAPATPVPASPITLPSTSLFPLPAISKAMTPSFAIPGMTSGGTPKASSLAKSHGFALPPPPSVGSNNPQTTNEMDDLREKLRKAEERAQQNYDEMKEYQSWLQQVEDGQETLKGSNEPKYEPVPDNPPGLWDRKDGNDVSIPNSDAGQDAKEWVTRISRKEDEKITVKPWPKCQDLDVWRMLYKLSVLHQLNYQTQTMLNSLTQVTIDSSPLTPNFPLPCRTWSMRQVKLHLK